MRARERRRLEAREIWAFQSYIVDCWKWRDGTGCGYGWLDGNGQGDGEMLDKLGERWAQAPARWFVKEPE